MKLGGLFSGVGGFELAWTQLGHEVAWMCEWDAKARKVLEARFPGVPIYPDVRDLDPAEVEAVDVLTGGSPCQGFSVAGARTGLEHSESQLFRDYIRIMDGLAERGLQYAIWENVPGVLSIQNEDGERTFNHVVAALAGGTEPVRLRDDKRWNTGLAAGRGRAVAWRVLDSRYFGVAQRRRRIFACVAFGDSCEDRAGRTLLAKPEGMSRHFAESDQAGQGTAGDSRQGAARASGFRMTAFGQYEDDDSASTLKQRDHKDATDLIVPDLAPTVTSKWAKGRGGPSGSETGNMVLDNHLPSWGMYGPSGQEGATEEEQPTITGSHGQPGNVAVPHSFDEMNFTLDSDNHHVLRAGTKQSTGVMVPQAFRKAARAQSSEDSESWVNDGGANTLNVFDVGDTRTTHAIVEPTAFTQNQREEVRVLGDQAGALAANTGMHQTNYIHAIVEPWGFSAGNSQHARSMGEEQGIAPPIRAGASGTNQSPTVGPVAIHAISEPQEEMVDFGRTSDRIRLNADTAATLQAGGGGAGAKTGLYMDTYAADETGTLQARGYKGLNHENVRDGQAVVQTYGVRRLTPVECERLQSFPDGWTEPSGSDSARYKAMGNAVTVNVVRWILSRLP